MFRIEQYRCTETIICNNSKQKASEFRGNFLRHFKDDTERRADPDEISERGSESRRDVEVGTYKRETVLLSQNNT